MTSVLAIKLSRLHWERQVRPCEAFYPVTKCRRLRKKVGALVELSYFSFLDNLPHLLWWLVCLRFLFRGNASAKMVWGVGGAVGFIEERKIEVSDVEERKVEMGDLGVRNSWG